MGNNVDEKKAKLPYHLVPARPLEQVVEVLGFGAKKYGPRDYLNEERGWSEEDYYSAALRHIQAWKKGEFDDPESGLPHISHAITTLLILHDIIQNRNPK